MLKQRFPAASPFYLLIFMPFLACQGKIPDPPAATESPSYSQENLDTEASATSNADVAEEIVRSSNSGKVQLADERSGLILPTDKTPKKIMSSASGDTPKIIVEKNEVQVLIPNLAERTPDPEKIMIALSENAVPPESCTFDTNAENLLVSPGELQDLTLLPNHLYSYSVCLPAKDSSGALEEIAGSSTFSSPAESPELLSAAINETLYEMTVRIDPKDNPPGTIYKIVIDSPTTSQTNEDPITIEVRESKEQNSDTGSLVLIAQLPRALSITPEQIQVVALNNDAIPSLPSSIKSAADHVELISTELNGEKIKSEMPQQDIDQGEPSRQQVYRASPVKPTIISLEANEEKIAAFAHGISKIEEAMIKTKADIASAQFTEEKAHAEVYKSENALQVLEDRISPIKKEIAANAVLMEGLKNEKTKSATKEKRAELNIRLLALERQAAGLEEQLAESLQEIEVAHERVKHAKKVNQDLIAKKKALENELATQANGRDTLRRYGNEAKIERNEATLRSSPP